MQRVRDSKAQTRRVLLPSKPDPHSVPASSSPISRRALSSVAWLSWRGSITNPYSTSCRCKSSSELTTRTLRLMSSTRQLQAIAPAPAGQRAATPPTARPALCRLTAVVRPAKGAGHPRLARHSNVCSTRAAATPRGREPEPRHPTGFECENQCCEPANPGWAANQVDQTRQASIAHARSGRPGPLLRHRDEGALAGRRTLGLAKGSLARPEGPDFTRPQAPPEAP
jgi:hypothetical protein